MEARTESQRLIKQERSAPSHPRLIACGLKPGMSAVDIGCGSGATLPALLDLVGPTGRVTAVEPSEERLRDARAAHDDHRLTFVCSGFPDTTLPSASADFVWSQFVFEYLTNPEEALAEMRRIAKPGGKVVVSDIDGFGLGLWPVPEPVKAGIPHFLGALAKTGFDIEIGRKLFTLFHRSGLIDVRVHLSPFYLAPGAADERLIDDWVQRFRVLQPVAAPALGGAEAYHRFCEAYLGALSAPDALKFAIVLVTEGTRP